MVCRGEGFLTEYRTNVFGVIDVTNAFLPFMRERQGGTIVVIGSRSAWQAEVPVSRAFLTLYDNSLMCRKWIDDG